MNSLLYLGGIPLAAYDEVWDHYLYSGLMLTSFSPYTALLKGSFQVPPLPFDSSEMIKFGATVPDAARSAHGHRELLALLEAAGKEALAKLTQLNPITRNKGDTDIIDGVHSS